MRHLPAAATTRLRDQLATAPDGQLAVLHRGPHAVYLTVPGHGAWALGVLATGAARVPNGLRTALPHLCDLDLAAARLVAGTLLLGDTEVRVTRLVDATVPGVAAADGGRLADVLAGIGRGDGLTPYGDDVACGWLATRYAAGLPTSADEVRAAARRTTLLSATLLECALHGEVLPEFAAWLARRGAPEEAALALVGASSGRGLLEGARLALGAEVLAA
jgi:hypothetical protein